MPTDDERADKPTDSDERTVPASEDVPTRPLIHVDVPAETVRKAARLADEYGIALEDAMARLTAYTFPADAMAGPPGDDCSSEGPADR